MADLYRELPLTFGTPTMSPHCDDDLKYGVVDKVLRDFNAMQDPGPSSPARRSRRWSRSTG